MPASDLALKGLDMHVYCSTVRESWPGLDVETLRGVALVGNIFQLLAHVDCESKGLSQEWLHRPMKHMGSYRAEMARAIEAGQLE
jgi:hypothetical protein